MRCFKRWIVSVPVSLLLAIATIADAAGTAPADARRFAQWSKIELAFVGPESIGRGKAFCLAKRGAVYALYLPEGGDIELDLPAGRDFLVAWWNPTQGRLGTFTHPVRIGGGRRKLSAPKPGDWAVRIESTRPLPAAP